METNATALGESPIFWEPFQTGGGWSSPSRCRIAAVKRRRCAWICRRVRLPSSSFPDKFGLTISRSSGNNKPARHGEELLTRGLIVAFGAARGRQYYAKVPH